MSSTLRGGLWMLASVFSFSGVGVGVRALSDNGMPPVEVVFFRVLVGVLVLLPWLVSVGLEGLKTTKLKLHSFRSLLMGIGMIFWFTALARLPLADAIALHFTLPLFLVIFAWSFLGEKVIIARLTATFIGFIGALVIIRPGLNEFSIATLFVLVSAALYAGNHTISRSFAQTEGPEATTFFMNAMILVPTGICLVFWWKTPTLIDFAWIAVTGIFGTTSHIFLMRAYQFAEASVLAPIDFLRLVFSGLAGYIIFGQISDFWTWVGATIIFLAAWYNTRVASRKHRDTSV